MNVALLTIGLVKPNFSAHTQIHRAVSLFISGSLSHTHIHTTHIKRHREAAVALNLKNNGGSVGPSHGGWTS